MICNTIGLTADSYQSIYVTGGAEVAEVYGGLNYSDLIFLKTQTLTGTAPLYFDAYAEPISDYTIHGNSYQDGTPSPDMPVDVVGCGDRTENLFDKENVLVNYYLLNGVPTKYDGDGSVVSDYIPIASSTATISAKITVIRGSSGTHYAVYDENKEFIRGWTTFLADKIGNKAYILNTSGAAFIRVDYPTQVMTDCMLNLGSTALPYEPYGYKIPITISDGTNSQTYPIYLSEPLRKQLSGDAVDELSYAAQTLTRRVDANCDPLQTPTTETVELPQIQTGNGQNTLTVGTTLQPSTVSITGHIKPTGYGQLVDSQNVPINDSTGESINVHGQS